MSKRLPNIVDHEIVTIFHAITDLNLQIRRLSCIIIQDAHEANVRVPFLQKIFKPKTKNFDPSLIDTANVLNDISEYLHHLIPVTLHLTVQSNLESAAYHIENHFLSWAIISPKKMEFLRTKHMQSLSHRFIEQYESSYNAMQSIATKYNEAVATKKNYMEKGLIQAHKDSWHKGFIATAFPSGDDSWPEIVVTAHGIMNQCNEDPPILFSISSSWCDDDTSRLLKITRSGSFADGSYAAFCEIMITATILAIKTNGQNVSFETMRQTIYGSNPPCSNPIFMDALKKLTASKGSDASISVLKKAISISESHWKQMNQILEPFFECVGSLSDLGVLLRNCSQIRMPATTKYFDWQGNACNGPIPIELGIHALQSV